MFRVSRIRSVDWPVDVKIPQDGGSVQKQRFTAKFEILDHDEWNAMVDANVDYLPRVLIGWGGDLKGASGEDPLEFNEENKANLLKIPYVRIGLLRAYQQASTGQEVAKQARQGDR